MADRQRLVQVLNNLLANAARHAPDSAPIRIAAEREGLDVAVSVADEGRGIAPDQLGQLFRKYTAAGDRKGGLGSGLGLAICKGLVEAQGGRIRAESGGVGLGARFTFTIPVAEAAGDRPAPARPGPPGHAPDAVPILVVDDDPETLRHLRDTLAEAGYAPLVTGSGPCSCTRRIARSRTSGEYRLGRAMGVSSQGIRPPRKPVRFRSRKGRAYCSVHTPKNAAI